MVASHPLGLAAPVIKYSASVETGSPPIPLRLPDKVLPHNIKWGMSPYMRMSLNFILQDLLICIQTLLYTASRN